MTKRTEQSTCHGRDYREHGQFFFKKYKAENINAIELCQTASVVIYNYFVSCLCCDQETSWFRNILADIIGYEDCVFQINLKYYSKIFVCYINVLLNLERHQCLTPSKRTQMP